MEQHHISTILSRKTQQQKGFTLLELIVVLVLIGLILAITAPSLENPFLNPLKKTTRQLSYFFHNAREEAQASQNFCKIRYSYDKKHFTAELFAQNQLTETEDVTESAVSTLIIPQDITVEKIELSGVRTIETDSFESWIGPKGYTKPLAIHLRNIQGDVFSLHVEPIIPKIRIFHTYTPLSENYTSSL